jgi:hypothetical protein
MTRKGPTTLAKARRPQEEITEPKTIVDDSALVLQLLEKCGRVSLLHPRLHGVSMARLSVAAMTLCKEGYRVFWDSSFLCLPGGGR